MVCGDQKKFRAASRVVATSEQWRWKKEKGKKVADSRKIDGISSQCESWCDPWDGSSQVGGWNWQKAESTVGVLEERAKKAALSFGPIHNWPAQNAHWQQLRPQKVRVSSVTLTAPTAAALAAVTGRSSLDFCTAWIRSRMPSFNMKSHSYFTDLLQSTKYSIQP
jgi:hypothetical protein